MAELRVTILGCGSSGGVPRLGGRWGACDPTNPKNRRRRCSILVERFAEAAAEGAEPTRVLVDAGPDMRAQLLDAGVGRLDGVLFTHDHADHCHGLDDLRQIVFNRRAILPCWAPPASAEILLTRFGYVFESPPGSLYPPILAMNLIEGPICVDGPGGALEVLPFATPHGAIEALGFRFGPVAYLPDASAMSEAAWAAVQGLDCWIVDALRYEPHSSHSHLAQTLDWIERAAPRRAVITNMHIDLDHDRVAAETPAHVAPAHDGMTLAFAL
ncbi:MBL fold metallo-hydrolase [Rubrimonas cliftonensis]|uniref:Phosphoribosyl 1,2-cyclic phosphate phosphodiesterase n=1 Tax=Rubrimonas cliftonensis TaxID=89524 RepID=A0A1H3VFP4_9RHOB|nr:MBL fold metallo-hydrolase [Rubrimonas cliftonensis]SDZ73605.1 phosphoribosyl 1,2-cyclic phosphate phosphodiesterase [Rubrimonas cliftonensis]